MSLIRKHGAVLQVWACLALVILITVVDFAELLIDFSYTNFTVGPSDVDALDRLRVHLNIILFQLCCQQQY